MGGKTLQRCFLQTDGLFGEERDETGGVSCSWKAGKLYIKEFVVCLVGSGESLEVFKQVNK